MKFNSEEELKKAIKKWEMKQEPISKRQGKQQLVISGLDDDAQAAIDSITNPTDRKLTQIWFDDASYWERSNPYLIQLATELGLSEDQLDDLFIQASKL